MMGLMRKPRLSTTKIDEDNADKDEGADEEKDGGQEKWGSRRGR